MPGSTGNLNDWIDASTWADEATAALDPDDDEPVYSTWTTETDLGHVVRLDADDDDLARRWLTSFAERLGACGFTGSLSRVHNVSRPAWAEGLRDRYPTAFVSWMLEPGSSNARRTSVRWRVPAERTDRIAHLADRWGRIQGADVVLSQGPLTFTAEIADCSAALARGARRAHSAELGVYDQTTRSGAQVSFRPNGESTFQAFGAGTWLDRVDRLRQALVALPADLNFGFVRQCNRLATSMISLDSPYALPPDIYSSHAWSRPDLHDRYLPDAHGLQVVRTGHLDRARDLSAWTITDLGSDRHLVEAEDLAPWYAGEVPDARALARARHDFEGALLTPQVLADGGQP